MTQIEEGSAAERRRPRTPLLDLSTLPATDLRANASSAAVETSTAPPHAWRYETRSLLGEGGMGRVHLCRDTLMGRDVALKVMLPELQRSADVRLRFLREATVQGQLEHPGIVPVHDIGVTPEGAAFFTMKRVRGLTLETILEKLVAGDPETAERFTQRKLLAAFGSVCLAIHFAHSSGVLHRDLKPANVMLGSFGEVYVLDWGVARFDGESSTSVDSLALTTSGTTQQDVAHTRAGTVLGTPAYMAPEQLLEGRTSARSDVYTLGAILFEILALETLYSPDDGPPELAVRRGLDARLSVRCPGRAVAPELETICLKATARLPGDRYATARELSDAIDEFLEGDRDLVRRRELAAAHAAAASAALREETSTSEAFERTRSRAMRELANALALDPGNNEARTMMMRTLLDEPAQIPEEVRLTLVRAEQKTLRMGTSLGTLMMLSWFAFLPALWWAGVWDIRTLAPIGIPITLGGALSFLESRRAVIRPRVQYLTFGLFMVAIAALSRIFGPFVLVPTLAATFAASMQVNPERRPRFVALAMAIAAIVAPLVLEYTGLVPRTFSFVGNRIVLKTVGTVGEVPGIALVTLATVSALIAPCIFIGRYRDALSRAERRLQLHAWHVRRMMPEGVPDRPGLETGDLSPSTRAAIRKRIREP